MIYGYVAASNTCVKPEVEEKLSRIEKLDDAGLRAAAQRHWEDVQQALQV